jgi:hypothetical protein
LRVELVGEASDPYVPCCALILSLLAQPLLAVPGVRHFLARLIPEDRSCCEPYGEASARSFLVRSRILVPLLALELFLFSIGTAGAVEIFSSPSVSNSVLQIPICSVALHRALAVFRQH